ncbi:MAG: shikimate kinase [Paracoccaceae bacterium]
MRQILSKSITLVGLMGSGKSAIGKMLSERMGLPLSDTDRMIEKEVGKEIPQIFNDLGERYFRQVEEIVVAKALDDTAHIISTGGGAILSPKTRSEIKFKSCSIWIQCDAHIILKRIIHQEKRPLLNNKNILDALIKKNEERIKFYRQADIHIMNETSNLEIVVEAIIKNLLFKKVLKNND